MVNGPAACGGAVAATAAVAAAENAVASVATAASVAAGGGVGDELTAQGRQGAKIVDGASEGLDAGNSVSAIAAVVGGVCASRAVGAVWPNSVVAGEGAVSQQHGRV